jgi:hypothetical protein
VETTRGPLVTTLCVPPVERSFFSMRASGEGRCVRVVLTGTADLRCQPAFEGFLGTLHRETVSVGADEVEVEMRALEFMSAACFRAMVAWVARVDEASRPYRIRVLADPHRQWQRRSMHALTCFASDFVTVLLTPDAARAIAGG